MTLLEHRDSPVQQMIADPDIRRALVGLAMGLTAIGIIYSPWGKRSGAHINPAVTLAFLRLGKIKAVDAAFYVLAQFGGGTIGVLIVWTVFGSAFSEPPVYFVNTVPGRGGAAAAFAVEVGMACGLMLMIVVSLASSRLMPFIGLFAGIMITVYIAVFAPVSGMSINPARTLASAAPGGVWEFLWIYVTAPVIGMLAAVEIYRFARLGHERFCAKLNHDPAYRCIHCGHVPSAVARKGAVASSNAQPDTRDQKGTKTP